MVPTTKNSQILIWVVFVGWHWGTGGWREGGEKEQRGRRRPWEIGFLHLQYQQISVMMYNDTTNVNYKTTITTGICFRKTKWSNWRIPSPKDSISLLSFLKQTLHDGLRDTFWANYHFLIFLLYSINPYHYNYDSRG